MWVVIPRVVIWRLLPLLFVEPEIQERIVAVYNNDGPGFLEDVFESAGYRAICQKIRTFIPQTSLFGMMLEHAEQFTIVQSSRLFLMRMTRIPG